MAQATAPQKTTELLIGGFKMAKDLATLEEENEAAALHVSIEERRALAREAKKRWGPDWQKMFSGARSGIDWGAVKFKL